MGTATVEARFDAVFFDSGGTLFDYAGQPRGEVPSAPEVRAGRVQRTTALILALGHRVEKSAVARALERATTDLAEQTTHSSLDLIARLYRHLGLPCRLEEVLCVAEAYEGPRYREWLFPDVHRALAVLREADLPLGLIANTTVPGYIFDRMLRGVGLLDCFAVRVYSCEEGVAKPNGEFFLRAARRLGVEGKRILYVGDSPEDDLVGAHSVGWQCALRIPPTGPPEGVGSADFIFSDWLDLIHWVLPEGERGKTA